MRFGVKVVTISIGSLVGVAAIASGILWAVSTRWYTGKPSPHLTEQADVLRGRLVVIDPGHVDYSTGAVGRGGLTEADVNLAVAMELKTLLEEAGARVLLTSGPGFEPDARAGSDREDLNRRCRVANKAGLFVSVHHNAFSGFAPLDLWVNRIEVFYYDSTDKRSEQSRKAAEAMLGELKRALRLPGKLNTRPLQVTAYTKCPAILTEASFISNPLMERKLARTENQRLEAEALFAGIVAYFAE